MLSVALRLWEFARAVGARVITQVAGWQKVRKHRKTVRSNLDFQQSESLAVAWLLIFYLFFKGGETKCTK